MTDEVISSFSDAYLLIGGLRRAGLIDSRMAAAIERVDDHVEQIPADETLADSASLETHVFWAQARVLALEALSAMSLPVGPALLRHVRYVE